VLVTSANKPLKNVRIRNIHAQIMACAEAMSDLGVVPLTRQNLDDLYEHLVERAWKRHQSIKADHPMVQEFWETFDYLESKSGQPTKGSKGLLTTTLVNHHSQSDFIGINFPQFLSMAAEHKLHINNVSDLKKLIKTSKHFKFHGYKAIQSQISNKSTKCFVFERKKESV